MSRRYPKEFHDFMHEYIPGHTSAEISAEAERRLGIRISPSAVKSYKTNHKIRSGTPTGLPRHHPSDRFPQEIIDYIVANHKGVGPKEMAARLNEEHGTNYTPAQIKGYDATHGLSSGLTGYFQKGSVPPNKGKKIEHPHPNSVATQFKPGHTPANKLPIGTVLEKDDGYLWRKIGEGARDWKQEHILIYEEAHGPLPPGGVLTFLDGDRHNVSLGNLKLITNEINLELNRRGLRTGDADLNETGILIATLSCSTRKAIQKKGATHE